MTDTLGILFGSAARIKVMRLFIFNPDECFSVGDITSRAVLSDITTKRELLVLLKSGFIERKPFVREVEKKVRGKKVKAGEKHKGYVFDQTFLFTVQFKSILMEVAPLKGELMVKRFNKAGKMKLIITAGIFQQNPDSRLDLLIVGDRLNKVMLDKTIKNLEAEIGRELRYAIFETPDFNYRVSVLDRLVRDVLEYPHQKLLNIMGFEG